MNLRLAKMKFSLVPLEFIAFSIRWLGLFTELNETAGDNVFFSLESFNVGKENGFSFFYVKKKNV